MMRKVEDFNKNCLEKQIRTISSVLIFSIKNNIRKFCTGKKSKLITDLVSVGACANQEIRLQVPCMEMFQNVTKQLLYLPDDRFKIPHACCNYVEAMSCASTFLDNTHCARNKKPIILDFIRGLIGGVTDLICTEYDGSTDKCDKLPKAVPKQKNKRIYLNFVTVMIDVMDSIKDPDQHLLPGH